MVSTAWALKVVVNSATSSLARLCWFVTNKLRTVLKTENICFTAESLSAGKGIAGLCVLYHYETGNLNK